MPPHTRLVIAESLLARIVAHAREELPNECCGLLAGAIEDGVAVAAKQFRIANDLHSSESYVTNARDLFDAFRSMRSDNLELLAVYHSHPTSSPVPSRRDVAENTYGETVIHLIVGLSGSEADVRAWWISEAGFREAECDRL